MPGRWLKLFPKAERTQSAFLLDGKQAFAAMLAAIDTAQKPGDYIYILGWMLDIDLELVPGDASSTLFNRLSKAAGSGVEVRILIWDNPSPPGTYDLMLRNALSRLGAVANIKIFADAHTFFPQASKDALAKIQAQVFHALQILQRLLSKLSPKVLVSGFTDPETDELLQVAGYAFALLDLLQRQSLGAHHEKITVVRGKEGLIGFCGGLDYNANRLRTSTKVNQKTIRFAFPGYHDTACRLQGPAAYQLLQKFRVRWAAHPQARAEKLADEEEKKPPPSAAPAPHVAIVGTYNSPDGKQPRDRTLRKAYFDIIDAAQRTIYIEDQYFVDMQVAARLNTKIRQPSFETLLMVTQDADETQDLLIPNRKRNEFLRAVLKDASPAQAAKVVFAVLDKTQWKTKGFHPGMHSKALVADDEIAIIGSANINRRGFTCDSETSAVIFNEPRDKYNFAKSFRQDTFTEFLYHPSPSAVSDVKSFVQGLNQTSVNFAKVIIYKNANQEDVDVRLKALIKKYLIIITPIVLDMTNNDLEKTSIIISPNTIDFIFDMLWEYILEPDAG